MGAGFAGNVQPIEHFFHFARDRRVAQADAVAGFPGAQGGGWQWLGGILERLETKMKAECLGAQLAGDGNGERGRRSNSSSNATNTLTPKSQA